MAETVVDHETDVVSWYTLMVYNWEIAFITPVTVCNVVRIKNIANIIIPPNLCILVFEFIKSICDGYLRIPVDL